MPKAPIEYNKLKEIILHIKQPETQAAMALQYALASRIGELFPRTHNSTKGTYQSEGLLVSSFHEYPNHWEIDVPNFKQKRAKTIMKKGFLLKQGEDWLTSICLGWRNKVSDSGKEQLFTCSVEAMRKRISKALKIAGYDVKAQKYMSSHNLRDSRADHLLKLFGFSILDIQKTLGHASLKTTNEYIDSSVDERVKKMQQATLK